MRILKLLVLYTGLALGANGLLAGTSEIAQMRTGDMKKLVLHSAPKDVSAKAFLKDTGEEGFLSEYEGKITLLNFWATWCAPCRKEMPMLSELQTELGGDDFEVVTLATGRNAPPAMKRFFGDIEVTNLPLHRDPKQAIARDMGVFGLPITVILDRDGQEIARMRGDADWSSESAKQILRALIQSTDDTAN